MTAEKKSVVTVLRALEALSSELGVDAPLTYARVLLYVSVAGDSGMDHGDLTKMLDTSPAATVRATQALGKFHWTKDEHGNKKPGLDLMETEQNPQNFRLRTHKLTAKGKRLIEKLAGGKTSDRQTT